MDCESVDIYPVGWGELVGHKLEGPRQAAPLKKEKKKAVGKRGKKRAHGNGAVSPGSGLSQVSTYLAIANIKKKVFWSHAGCKRLIFAIGSSNSEGAG